MNRSLTILLFFLFTALQSVQATHIVGGDLTCRWISGNTFEVSLIVFRDCNPGSFHFDPQITIGIYDKATDAQILTYDVDILDSASLQLSGNLCTPPPNICVLKARYIHNVVLPNNPNGYYISWERCCRNASVQNINNPLAQGMAFYCEISDPALHNSTPVFLNAPLPYMCVNQPFSYNFNGFDQDGDSLVYALVTPLAGNSSQSTPIPPPGSAPYPPITWTGGYGIADVCGGSPPLTVNSVTGQMNCTPNTLGIFAMAEEIREYRNGVLISIVRREIEFNVIQCQLDNAPALSPNVVSGNFIIHATDTLCFNITATDLDPTDSLYLSFTGDVFVGGTGVAPYAVSAPDSGINHVQTNFCWLTACSNIDTVPYNVHYTVRDNGCPFPKTSVGDFTITVLPPPVPEPPAMLCISLPTSDDLMLYWRDTLTLRRYFARYTIYRSVDGSPFIPVDTVTSQSINFYHDITATNNQVINYCYYIQGTDICGNAGPTSDTICGLNIQNPTNYIKYATVIANDEVFFEWQQFPGWEYCIFYIYKKENSTFENYELIDSLFYPSNTTYLDLNVSTSAHSYCYKIKYRDQCGNMTPLSNEACTILLDGTNDWFTNHLKWTSYTLWHGGVADYSIHRKITESDPFDSIATVWPSHRFWDDSDLNNYGGGFYYYIQAHEGAGSFDAHSESNIVELTFPPFLYLPSAFTPNYDDRNPTWSPASAFVKTFSFRIWNRWGERIFETTEANHSWDGTYKGEPCPEGVYIYEVYFTGYDNPNEYKKVGSVTLIR